MDALDRTSHYGQVMDDTDPASINADINTSQLGVEESWFPYRYRITVLALFGFTNAFALRASFNIALVSMVNFTSSVGHNSTSKECPALIIGINRTDSDKPGEFNWDADIQSVLLGAFFYGYVTTQFPGGMLAERFGAHLVFGCSVAIPGALTFLIPLIAHWNVYLVIAVRVLTGFAMGPLYPSFYYLMSRWAPPFERTRLLGIAITGANIGSVIAFGLSGFLCDLSEGWTVVFYLFGALSCFWFIFWFALASDSPSVQRGISLAELAYIESKTEHMDDIVYHRPPFLCMLKSKPVWALFIMMVGDSMGYYTVFNCAPLYMKQVLKYDIMENGVIQCLPYIAGFCVAFLVTPLADFIISRGILGTTATRKLFTFIGEGFQAVALTAVGLVGCNRVAAAALMISAVGVSSFALGGFAMSHVDIAPTYTGTLMGITNGLSNAAGFIAPAIVGRITHNDASRSDWQIVFFLMGGILGLSTLIFILFGSGEEEEWSREGRERHLHHKSAATMPSQSLHRSDDGNPLLEHT